MHEENKRKKCTTYKICTTDLNQTTWSFL